MDSPQTLVARIEQSVERRPDGQITFISGDIAAPVTWADLHRAARAYAVALADRGLRPGDHVAILGPTTRHLVTAIQGVWLAGGTVMVLPLPMRMSSIDEFVRQTRTRITAGDTAMLLIDHQLAEFYEPEVADPPMLRLEELDTVARRFGDQAYVRPEIDPDSLAILQFTSGSTSDPKGVMLPHRTVCANLDAIASAAALDPDDDVLVSWLPLYHDMGLVGKLCTTMTTATDLVLAAPQDFLARPARWMQWMSDHGGTASAAPNFAYALAARSLGRLDGLDLSRWRVALNGAEPVDPATIAAFVEAGERHGLSPSAVFPAFGMAEVAIAGAFPPPDRGMQIDTVDGEALEAEGRAVPVDGDADGVRHLVKLGGPVPGLEMRICDPTTGVVRGEREIGELEIRGTSVTPGYYRNDEATQQSFRSGGWFRTGDLAYLVDGELVICGRIKDVIIVAGRNVFPQDIERAVAEVDGVRKGNVAVFGVSGRRRSEDVVVVAEARADDLDAVRAEVAAAVHESASVPAREVVLVEPGTLPKTSSGKLQRQLTKRLYRDGHLATLSLAV